MIHSHDLLDKVLEKNSKHPDLLICDGTARAFVHTVASESCHKLSLVVINHCFMQIFHLGFIITVYRGWRCAQFAKSGLKRILILFKERVQLVKVGHTSSDRLRQLLVSLNKIFLRLNSAVEHEKLEIRLAIAHLGGLLKHSLSFVQVFSDTIALHVKHTHPVLSDQTVLLRSHIVILCSFFLVRFIFGLSMGKFGQCIACAAILARGTLNYCLKALQDFFEVWMARESNIIVCFVPN